jgi:hypothetical protein
MNSQPKRTHLEGTSALAASSSACRAMCMRMFPTCRRQGQGEI